LGVAHRGTVATQVDRVHDREGAADAKDEAEEEPDRCAKRDAHSSDDVTPRGKLFL